MAYVAEWNVHRDRLDEHLIPVDFTDASSSATALMQTWGADNVQARYPEFVLRRTELLAHEATAFLASL